MEAKIIIWKYAWNVLLYKCDIQMYKRPRRMYVHCLYSSWEFFKRLSPSWSSPQHNTMKYEVKRENLFHSVSSKISKSFSFPSSKHFPFSFCPVLRFTCLLQHSLFKRLWYHLIFSGFRKKVSEILVCFWYVRTPCIWVLKILLNFKIDIRFHHLKKLRTTFKYKT